MKLNLRLTLCHDSQKGTASSSGDLQLDHSVVVYLFDLPVAIFTINTFRNL